jgi:Cft2 family RNA processing exonuclease
LTTFNVSTCTHYLTTSKTFSLDDVDAAFEKFKSLKYSQHLKFSEGGRGAGVTITPYAAGR